MLSRCCPSMRLLQVELKLALLWYDIVTRWLLGFTHNDISNFSKVKYDGCPYY